MEWWWISVRFDWEPPESQGKRRKWSPLLGFLLVSIEKVLQCIWGNCSTQLCVLEFSCRSVHDVGRGTERRGESPQVAGEQSSGQFLVFMKGSLTSG